MNTTGIQVKDGMLSLPMEPIIAAMNMEQKREVLAWLATDAEVVESVVAHITGNDDQGWSTGDPNLRQRMLTTVEDSQGGSLKYNWNPWCSLRDKIKNIRSTEHLYWVLYHKIDKDLSRKVMDELSRLGVESNYTTAEGDKDIAEIREYIETAFAAMKKESNQ